MAEAADDPIAAFEDDRGERAKNGDIGAVGPRDDFERQVYTAASLLQCRLIVPDDSPKPEEVAHLKFLAASQLSSVEAAAEKAATTAPAAPASDMADTVGEAAAAVGEAARVASEAEDSGQGAPGPWWRVRCTS